MAKIVPIDGSNKIRLPGPRDRIVIVGRTGSGKTVAAAWHLSNASFNVRPWVVINPKRDELIESIQYAEHIDVGVIPKSPGIYICNPIPSQADELDQYLLDIWEQGNIGVYSDEGYMCGDGAGITACLTQGRSKQIPMILLAQRPVYVSRFCFSEAGFIQVFDLIDLRDKKTVLNFAPVPYNKRDKRLPDFNSWYYDVGRNKMFVMKPVPDGASIVVKIDARLEAMQPKKGVRYL